MRKLLLLVVVVAALGAAFAGFALADKVGGPNHNCGNDFTFTTFNENNSNGNNVQTVHSGCPNPHD